MQNIKHRIPHIMKALKTTQHPSNFLFFDTETKDRLKGKGKGIQQHTLWFGWVWAFRYEQGKVTREMKARFSSPDGFYSIVHQRLEKSRTLYCFAHNLGFDLTQVDFWDKHTELDIHCSYAILEDPPLFLSLSWHGKKLVMLDTFNFWKCSVDDMGKSLGVPKLAMPNQTASKKEWDKYCLRDVEILANQVTSLLDFLTVNDLGSFGVSAPSIAMNIFRHKFMKHEIFIHDRATVLDLERNCYYGGLVQNYFIGKVKDKTIYHTDVNSLYPSVMRLPVPHKLNMTLKNLSAKDFQKRCYPHDCCAWVIIADNDNEYSKRHNNRLCQVTGLYQTFLAGPELQRAFDNHSVAHVLLASVYSTECIFADFVNYFWNKRKEYKAAGNGVNEQMVKLFMNSLYGKFGQKGFDWVDYEVEHLRIIFEMHGLQLPAIYDTIEHIPSLDGQSSLWYPEGLDSAIKLRYVAGKLQMQMPSGEHSESFCAIAAFITAYARERIRSLAAIAGRRHVYYCDTDSLFVDDFGLHQLKLAGEVSQSELGKLKIEGKAKNPVFYGPKDYTFADKTVLKGIRKNAVHIKGTTYEQDQFEKLKSILKRGGQAYVEIKRIQKTNSRLFTKGHIGYGGWTVPFRLNENASVDVDD